MAKRTGSVRRTWVQRIGYAWLRVLARLAAVLIFRLRCTGQSNYPRSGGGLLCANHQSYLDPALVGLTCDRRLNYLARSTLFRSRMLRLLIEFLDAIPIEREGLGLAGLKETLRRLKHGELVLIFPEGTRTTNGEVSPLKPGFCAVARRAAVPLIPIAIAGAYEAWPRKARLPHRTTIRIVVGEPITVPQFQELTDPQLVAELERRIRDCFEKASAWRFPPSGV